MMPNESREQKNGYYPVLYGSYATFAGKAKRNQ
jgi:hypothetical protein